MLESKLGGKFNTEVPRRWYKMKGGKKIGEKLRSAAGDEDDREALDLMLPDSDFDVFKLEYYDGRETRDHPSQVIMSTKDPEDFTMEVYSLQEPANTTNKNGRLDDRLDDIEVRCQFVQGEGHGYAHVTNRGQGEITVGELQGSIQDIIKGSDGEEWEVTGDTRPWTAKMDPNPIDFYKIGPEGADVEQGMDVSEEIEQYMDEYKDAIDMAVAGYDSKVTAWADVKHRRYNKLAENLDGVSGSELESLVESFPEKMDRLYDEQLG